MELQKQIFLSTQCKGEQKKTNALENWEICHHPQIQQDWWSEWPFGIHPGTMKNITHVPYFPHDRETITTRLCLFPRPRVVHNASLTNLGEVDMIFLSLSAYKIFCIKFYEVLNCLKEWTSLNNAHICGPSLRKKCSRRCNDAIMQYF